MSTKTPDYQLLLGCFGFVQAAGYTFNATFVLCSEKVNCKNSLSTTPFV